MGVKPDALPEPAAPSAATPRTKELTTENKSYGTGWQTCEICNLTAVDVVGNKCPDPTRCKGVLRGTPLGPPLALEAPVRFDLDADEQSQVQAAVQRWRRLNVDEEP